MEYGMSTASYGMHKTLKGTTFEAAVAAVTEALKGEGFGVLTEIDVKATLKKKIDVDFRPYAILGACNPKLAHQALSAEPDVGLLLPCNVVVQGLDDGDVKVSILDPALMGRVAENDALEPLMADARARLSRALESLG